MKIYIYNLIYMTKSFIWQMEHLTDNQHSEERSSSDFL